MNWIITIYIALLFFALCPGILVSLPPKRGKFTTAAVHAFIFAIVFHFTHKFVMRMTRMEGLANENDEVVEVIEESPTNADDEEDPVAAAKKRIALAVASAAAKK